MANTFHERIVSVERGAGSNTHQYHQLDVSTLPWVLMVRTYTFSLGAKFGQCLRCGIAGTAGQHLFAPLHAAFYGNAREPQQSVGRCGHQISCQNFIYVPK